MIETTTSTSDREYGDGDSRFNVADFEVRSFSLIFVGFVRLSRRWLIFIPIHSHIALLMFLRYTTAK